MKHGKTIYAKTMSLKLWSNKFDLKKGNKLNAEMDLIATELSATGAGLNTLNL